MKIVHISDLHISHKHRPDNIRYTRYLLEYALEQGVDHIVITGDLVHLTDIDDFLALRKLFEEYNLLAQCL